MIEKKKALLVLVLFAQTAVLGGLNRMPDQNDVLRIKQYRKGMWRAEYLGYKMITEERLVLIAEKALRMSARRSPEHVVKSKLKLAGWFWSGAEPKLDRQQFFWDESKRVTQVSKEVKMTQVGKWNVCVLRVRSGLCVPSRRMEENPDYKTGVSKSVSYVLQPVLMWVEGYRTGSGGEYYYTVDPAGFDSDYKKVEGHGRYYIVSLGTWRGRMGQSWSKKALKLTEKDIIKFIKVCEPQDF